MTPPPAMHVEMKSLNVFHNCFSLLNNLVLFIIDNKFHEEFFCLLTVSCYSGRREPGHYVVKFILYPAQPGASGQCVPKY